MNCLECKQQLTETELRDYGSWCQGCIDEHQNQTCKGLNCAACDRSRCWSCKGALEKVTVDLSEDPDHPYPDWYWRCRKCDEHQVKCKYCREATVDWWHESGDVWDDIYQCEKCGAPFCPSCNQQSKGCKHIDDYEFFCTGCVITKADRRKQILKKLRSN